MGLKKQSLLKRICIFVLCTCILFSGVFMSYASTLVVNAQDYDTPDVIRDIVGIALACAGIYTIVSTGGITAPAVLEIMGGLATVGVNSDNIYDYVKDNGDGTYTMSPEFIQMVIDEASKLEEQSFSDLDIQRQWDGHGYFLNMEYIQSPVVCTESGTYGVKGSSYGVATPLNFFQPSAFLYCDNKWTLYIKFDSSYTAFSSLRGDITCNVCGKTYSNYVLGAVSVSSLSSNVPIFSTMGDLEAYLKDGVGYQNALNYGAVSPFSYGSNYNPVYSGGSVTFSKSVLDGFNDKLQEVNEQVEDVDEKLQELIDYINGGGDLSGDSGGWLQRIYNKLCDILAQLKSIKRWTIIDTFIDGVDAIADWLDLIHDILSDVDDGMESAVSTLSSALDDATGLLKTKFPFSVPWDIFFFVTLLAAEPEVPHFEAPIDFDVSAIDMHVHYDFVVDFTDYQYLSDIFRVILSMTYAVGLLKMTAGIVSTKKEE